MTTYPVLRWQIGDVRISRVARDGEVFRFTV